MSPMGMISGKVLSAYGEAIDYATIFLKGTEYSCFTNERGLYHLKAPVQTEAVVLPDEKLEHPALGQRVVRRKLGRN